MIDILNALTLLGNFLIIPGLTYGSQLALGALGVTLVYGVLRFSNFAHGETMAFGAMITILVTWGLQSVGVSIKPLPTALMAIPIGIVVTVILTLGIDKIVYRYHRERNANPVIFLLVYSLRMSSVRSKIQDLLMSHHLLLYYLQRQPD